MTRRLTLPPNWIRPGARADYHSVIGGPVTKPGLTVVSDPQLLGGHTWVVWLDGVRGCVAIEAITEAKP
jgi:hypothetical protein